MPRYHVTNNLCVVFHYSSMSKEGWPWDQYVGLSIMMVSHCSLFLSALTFNTYADMNVKMTTFLLVHARKHQAVASPKVHLYWAKANVNGLLRNSMGILDPTMFLCRQNQAHTSSWRHYDTITCSDPSWLCDFSPREVEFTPREVKKHQNQGRPMFINCLYWTVTKVKGNFDLRIRFCSM